MKLNFTAPFNELSYGIVSVSILKELHASQHEVSVWPIGGAVAIDEDAKTAIQAGLDNARHRYSTSSPSLRIYHQFDLAQHVGKGLHCSLPIFELDKFSQQESLHLSNQDLIFSPSKWGKEVLVENGIPSERIKVAPFGIDTSMYFPAQGERKPGPTKFVNIGKWEVRKGHLELLQAFEKAFGEGDNVELYMVCDNLVAPENQKYNEQWRRYYQTSKLADKIKILSRIPTFQGMRELIWEMDCGVFPSKAEGWNLSAAEVAACGKPIIITECTAHTEWIDGIVYDGIEMQSGMEDAYDGVWFRGQGRWHAFKEREEEQLIHYLREQHNFIQEYGALKLDPQLKKWDYTANCIVEALM